MSPPDLDVARIRKYAETRVPEHARDQIRMEIKIRGNSVTLIQRRIPWREDFGPEWSTYPVAQLRWRSEQKTWRLYWRDRNTRWHIYKDCAPTPGLPRLLDEIDADPTSIFWG